MAAEFRVLRPREYHMQLVSKGHRADGRTLEEFRGIKIETEAIRTADSSSLVKIGNTSLVCGCIRSKVSPPDEEIKLKVELPPICSSPYNNRTHHTAQLLTKTLKAILNQSDCVDRQSFRIPDSDDIWSVDVEVICLNYDGSILDAALIAIITALKSLQLPSDSEGMGGGTVSFNSYPICTSFAMIGDHILCDPNMEEESVAQASFSITIDSASNRCCHISKVGGQSISSKELLKCIQLARSRAVRLQQEAEINGSSLAMT